MEKKYIKFGDNYLEIFEESGQLKIKTITDLQQISDITAEKVILTDEDPDNNALQKVFEEAEKELLSDLKKGLKQTVLKILGFDNSWGRGWEVKAGDNTQAAKLIAVNLEKVLGGVKEEEIMPTQKERDHIVAEIRQEVLSKYRHDMNRKVWQIVDNMVKEDCERIANELIVPRTKEIAARILDNFVKNNKKQG